jgi:hypothetical protein
MRRALVCVGTVAVIGMLTILCRARQTVLGYRLADCEKRCREELLQAERLREEVLALAERSARKWSARDSRAGTAQSTYRAARKLLDSREGALLSGPSLLAGRDADAGFPGRRR